MRRFLAPATCAAMFAVLAGCGATSSAVTAPPPSSAQAGRSDSTPTPKPSAGPPTVTIKGNKATPTSITVRGGATVKIKNQDKIKHNLEDIKHHNYDGDIPGKSTGELTAPPIPGSYTYFDRNHRSVQFTLHVQ